MTKLVLIDGNAVIHRAYHAMPPMRTPKGEAIAAVHGFVSMLLLIIEKLTPTHIAVCWDRAEKTFRQEKHAAYQSHRPALEPEFSSQFQKAYDVLTAMKIPQYSKAGYEADDIIGTLSAKATEMPNYKLQIKNGKGDLEVVIVTGDRDILQLVDDNKNIKVYLPIKGMSEGKVFGEQDVLEKMGVLPKNIVDYKALVGDPSDNYSGVPGIGTKTAINLINQYGSFHETYNHLAELPKGTAGKLQNGKASGELSYELATIVCDCDNSFDLKKASEWDIDSPHAMKLFGEYGFKSLPERVKKLGQKLDQEKQGSLF